MRIGDVGIEFLGHSGVLIENGKRIAIDPYNVSDSVGKVDFVLITHSHYDHCSIKDIQKISKNGTTVICPPDAQSKITRVENIDMQIMEVGDKIDFGEIKVEAVAAYNIEKEFHPKLEGWMGYVIKKGNNIFYHSGDSDKIDEMSKLTGYGKEGNNFIIFLPVSGKYVMDSYEAAEAAEMIKPSLAIPIHYGAGVVGTVEDAVTFVSLCEKKGIKAILLGKI